MFSNLMASAPKRSPLSPKAAGFSTLMHALALLGVMWGTARVSEAPTRMISEKVTYVDMVDTKEPPPPEQPPPPPEEPAGPGPAPVVEVEHPDVPQGFQQLAAPEEILATIPEPGKVAFKAEDFSGEGVAGGLAGGRPIVPSDTVRKPAVEVVPAPVSVAVVDERPRLKNLRELASRMQELYPPQYRIADIEGEVVVQLVVDTDGRVEDEGISVVSASYPDFEVPTKTLAKMLRWEPAKRNGHPVRVWVRLPVSWNIQ